MAKTSSPISFSSSLSNSFPSPPTKTPQQQQQLQQQRTPTLEEMKNAVYKFVYSALSAKTKKENSTNYNTLIASLSKKK